MFGWAKSSNRIENNRIIMLLEEEEQQQQSIGEER